jgi:hypothetical protein
MERTCSRLRILYLQNNVLARIGAAGRARRVRLAPDDAQSTCPG